MGQTISRRSVAKGAAWGVPALSLAAAAPAVAASCVPSTVSVATTAHWVSTQTDFTSPTGDPEYHTVQYTLMNTGDEAIPVGYVFEINVSLTVLTGEEAAVSVVSASNNVSTTIQNTSTDDTDAGTTTDAAKVTVVTTQAIAPGESFVVSVQAVYGALVQATDSVTAESPQSFTDEATCVTTLATVTTDGASDGTSYTS